MPERPSRINAALLERLDKFIEENYIPSEFIPKGAVFLQERNNIEISLSKKRGKEKRYEY
jgi:hypothetical protein